MLTALFNIIIFPGLLFLGLYSMVIAYIDNALAARFERRRGGCWYQPLADFFKLMGKETIIPSGAEQFTFSVLPVVTAALVTTAYCYIPLWKSTSLHSFNGDLPVVLFLLLLPTLCYALAGWYSHNSSAMIGSMRSLTQMFAYEVPFFMAILSPALLADTWSLSGIAIYYGNHPLHILINIPAFFIALISAAGKLNRPPFDLPDAGSGMDGGVLSAYSGRLLALFKLARSSELVVVCSLMAAVFVPFYFGSGVLSFVLYVAEILLLVLLLALLRQSTVRMRLGQIIMFYWKVLAPLAMIQLIANLFLKGVLN